MTDKPNERAMLIEALGKAALAMWNCESNMDNEAAEIEAVLGYLSQFPPAVDTAEIEVIGYFNPDNLARVKAGQISGFMLHDEESERINAAAMTVAQHRRILAGANQQAGSGWVACADRLPDVEEGKHSHFLVSVFRVRAQRSYEFLLTFANRYECLSGDEDPDADEYTHISGWYDSNDDGDYVRWYPYDEGDVLTHWQPLPPSPAAKAGEA